MFDWAHTTAQAGGSLRSHDVFSCDARASRATRSRAATKTFFVMNETPTPSRITSSGTHILSFTRMATVTFSASLSSELGEVNLNVTLYSPAIRSLTVPSMLSGVLGGTVRAPELAPDQRSTSWPFTLNARLRCGLNPPGDLVMASSRTNTPPIAPARLLSNTRRLN